MNDRIEKVSFYLGIVLLSLLIAIFLIISPRGFDLTDEGLYALLSNPAQENNFNILNYDILFKYLYSYTGIELNVLELRILRLGMLLSGSVYLFASLIAFIQFFLKDVVQRRLIFVVVLILAFWNYAPSFLQTPGYHSFHFLGLQLFIGSILFFHSGVVRYKLLNSFLFSFLCFIGLFLSWISKISSFPILFFILISQLILLKRNDYFFYCIFLLLVFLYLFLTFQYSAYAQRINLDIYKQVFQLLNQQQSTHSVGSLLSQFFIDVLIFSIAFLCGCWFFLKKNFFTKFRVIGVIFLSLAILVVLDYQRSYSKHSDLEKFFNGYLGFRFYISCAAFIAFLTGYCVRKHLAAKSIDKRRVFILVICNLLVVAYVFGSNTNNLFLGMASIQFFIMGILFIASRQFFAKLSLGVIVVSFVFFGVNLSLGNPDRQSPLKQQTFRYYYGDKKMDFIYLDSATYQTQIMLKSKIRNDSTNLVLGYTRMIGHIYLCGNEYTNPGSYLWGEEDLDFYFQYRFTNPERFLLILESRRQERKVMSYLRNYSIMLKDSVPVNSQYRPDSYMYIYKCESSYNR